MNPSLTNQAFDMSSASANGARQPGGGANQVVNGIANARPWPNTGEQMDMNMLWELVNNLSEVQQDIRDQTQGIMQRTQQLQSRGLPVPVQQHGHASGEGGAERSHGLNGDGGDALRQSTESETVAALRAELNRQHEHIQTLESRNQVLWTLVANHQDSMTTIMQKLRPYTQAHEEAQRSTKAHYLKLLEDERSQNKDLREEITELRGGLQRVLAWVRDAQRANETAALPYIRRIAALRVWNDMLCNICGLEPLRFPEDYGEQGTEEEKMVSVQQEQMSGGQVG